MAVPIFMNPIFLQTAVSTQLAQPSDPSSGIAVSLFVAVIWSAIGAGLFVYGKKTSSIPAMAAAVGLIVTGYFVSSALWMSLICIAILAAAFFILRDG